MGQCAICPVADDSECLGGDGCGPLPFLCEWAKTGDPIKLAHVVNRSAIGLAGAPAPTPRPLSRAEKPRVPLGAKPKGG